MFDAQAFDEGDEMSTITWDARVPAAGSRRPAPARRDRAATQVSSLRLTSRGRLVVVAFALLVAGVVGLSAQSADAGSPADAMAVTAHTVAAGETLWGIASGIVEPGQDVRDVVDSLVELNGLVGSGLQAGQQILVPASTGTD